MRTTFRIILAVALIALGATVAQADPNQLEWVRTYNSPANGDDWGEGIAVGGDGFVYVSGHEYRSDLGQNYNMWLRKYDPAGNTVWTRTYNSPANGEDMTNDVAVDPLGNVYMTGYEVRNDLGQGRNTWLRKYDANGNALWTRTYNGPANGYEMGAAITFDATGNVYLSGEEDRSDIGQSRNTWLRKYDPQGNPMWTQTYNASGGSTDRGEGVATDSAGNVYQSGYIGVNGGDIWLRKYDAQGNTLWTRTYNNPTGGEDRAFAVSVDGSGNAYLVGYEVRSDLGQGRNAWIRKYDTNGNELWTRTYDSPSNGWDNAYWVALGRSGGPCVVGYEARSDLGQAWNIWLREYDPEGNVLWTQSYNSPGNGDDLGYGVALDGSGSVYVAGTIGRTDIGQGRDIVVLKYGVVPEPFSLAFMGIAFAGVVGWRVRRRTRAMKQS